MDWDHQLFALFDDLEQQAAAQFGIERDLEVLERARAEYTSVTLASRLVATLGREIDVDVAGVGSVGGELRRVGDGWLLLHGHAQDWLIPSAAVQMVHGASQRSAAEATWSPLHKLRLGSALRRLAESEERCVIHLRDGGRHEGRLLRVGADFAEVSTPSGATALVAFQSLAAAQSRD